MFHFHRNIQRCALSYREFLRTIPLSTNKKKEKRKIKKKNRNIYHFSHQQLTYRKMHAHDD